MAAQFHRDPRTPAKTNRAPRPLFPHRASDSDGPRKHVDALRAPAVPDATADLLRSGCTGSGALVFVRPVTLLVGFGVGAVVFVLPLVLGARGDRILVGRRASAMCRFFPRAQRAKRARAQVPACPGRGDGIVASGARRKWVDVSRSWQRNVDSAPVRAARGIGGGFVRSTAFEVLSRAGFVARGLIYGIIGLFAFEVAVSDTGKLTNQQGAIRTVATQPFGEFLLLLLAIGLGGYAIWRIVRAALGHGPEDSDSTLRAARRAGERPRVRRSLYRVDQVAHGLGGGGPSSKPDQTTAGVFDWPAGRWLVGLAGVVMLGVAAYQFVKGVRRTFLEELKTGEMSAGLETWVTWIGTIGHVARAVVSGWSDGFCSRRPTSSRRGRRSVWMAP